MSEKLPNCNWFMDTPITILFEEGSMDFAIGYLDMKKQEKKRIKKRKKKND